MKYQGNELEIFKGATNWKDYWSTFIPSLANGIGLEVGAGIGGNIPSLLPKTSNLVLLEPDSYFCKKFLSPYLRVPGVNSVVEGTILSLDMNQKYDHIYYIDVLEHIYDDANELKLALQLLKPSGSVFILVPSHMFLYSKFDQSVGHHRRYSKKSFLSLLSKNSRVVQFKYLDSIGFAAAVINLALSQSGTISPKKVYIWNKFFVPISAVIDRLIGFKLGKSLLIEITNLNSD